MLPIRTARLTLRDITPGDFDAIHAYASLPEVCRFVGWGPNTEEDTRGFMARASAGRDAEPRTDFTLLVTLLSDNAVIGGCGLHKRDGAGEYFFGHVYHPDYWNQGYGTEVARALVAFAFALAGAQRVWTTCDTENFASARVLEKAGLVRTATPEKDCRIDGELRNSYRYEIERSPDQSSQNDSVNRR